MKVLTSMIQEVIDYEYSTRQSIENYCEENNIDRTIILLESKLSYVCSLCKDLNYLSYLECCNCKQKTCIKHLVSCTCKSSITLFYRHKHDLSYHFSKNKKEIKA